MTFERIYGHITDLAPQLAPKNTYVIHEWLASGYDTEKDIIPAIDIACKKGTRTIQSFAFFTGFIKRKHTERLQQAAMPKPVDPEQQQALTAKVIAWKRQRGMFIPSYDEELLNQYEAKHGRVEIK